MIADQLFGEFPLQMSLSPPLKPNGIKIKHEQSSTPPDIGHRGTFYPLERSVTLHSTQCLV